MKTLSATLLLLFICTTARSWSLADLTNADASAGLRQALEQGANQAVSSLGRKDGFLLNKQVRIPLPPRLAKAEKIMRMAGMGTQADDLVLAMNRAAEAKDAPFIGLATEGPAHAGGRATDGAAILQESERR